MKGYYDAKLSEALNLSVGESYDIAYGYDEAGRIIKEEVTGSIERIVEYTYDANDNISTEILTVEGKTITKTYTYDEFNNISGVNTVVS